MKTNTRTTSIHGNTSTDEEEMDVGSIEESDEESLSTVEEAFDSSDEGASTSLEEDSDGEPAGTTLDPHDRETTHIAWIIGWILESVQSPTSNIFSCYRPKQGAL
jgi:hypothetical protein